jgi:hypothetical protein
MLNSAAGVTLPSAIAPPISTMRSGSASGCSASSRVRRSSAARSDERHLAPCSRIRSARKSTAWRSSGRLAAGGAGQAVEALSRRARRRRRTARGRAAGPRPRRPESLRGRELEHADRVRRRLLERLVAGDRRHPDELELGRASASSSAIASSCRDRSRAESRVVLTRGVCGYLVRSRKRRLRAEARSGDCPGRARSAQRFFAVSVPRASETTRHAVNASRPRFRRPR